MNNQKPTVILTEDEYIKKILAPLYDNKAPRENIIIEGQRQVNELLDTENRIREQLIKLSEKYENQ